MSTTSVADRKQVRCAGATDVAVTPVGLADRLQAVVSAQAAASELTVELPADFFASPQVCTPCTGF